MGVQFGVHNSTNGTATMYIWNESMAVRGAYEICSCLRLFLQAIPQETKKLTCYSDSCYGQNKWYASGISRSWNALSRLIINFKLGDILTFQMTGISLRNGRLLLVSVPQDWEDVIHVACLKNPFDVVPIDTSNLLDIAEETKQYTCRKNDGTKTASSYKQSSLDELWTDRHIWNT